jgi:hypothetical protein
MICVYLIFGLNNLVAVRSTAKPGKKSREKGSKD